MQYKLVVVHEEFTSLGVKVPVGSYWVTGMGSGYIELTRVNEPANVALILSVDLEHRAEKGTAELFKLNHLVVKRIFR